VGRSTPLFPLIAGLACCGQPLNLLQFTISIINFSKIITWYNSVPYAQCFVLISVSVL